VALLPSPLAGEGREAALWGRQTPQRTASQTAAGAAVRYQWARQKMDEPQTLPAETPGRPAGFVPVPEDRAAHYRRAGHWTDSTVASALLAQAGVQDPLRPALHGDDETVTYGELPLRVACLAAGLRDAGLDPGDRVVVQLPNSPELIILLLALWRAGLIPVTTLPAHREHELRHVLSISGAVAMAVPDRFHRVDHLATARALRQEQPRLRTLLVSGAAPRRLEPGELALSALSGRGAAAGGAVRPSPSGPADVAVLLMSGGTTALPKLIPRTHADYLYNVRVSGDICQVSERTVYLAALPVAHNFALGCPGALGTLLRGGTVVFVTAPSAGVVLRAIAEHRVTMTAAVPPLAVQWADAVRRHGGRLESLELLQVGGARLLPEAAHRLRATFPGRLQQVYGMAEGLLNFTRPDDPEDVVIATQGRPASPDDELRIVDREGRAVPEGEVGELWTRGPYTIAGYFGAGDHNAVAFTPDGFFRTGDLVRRHESGNLVVEGRLKDVINRGGEKVAAAELENLVLAHPAVLQVAAVAMPDVAMDEAICLFVVPHAGRSLSLAEARTFLTERGLARFKLPDRLETISDLPVTSVGKVDKRRLRELAVEVTR
jgi:2,3-dihydroxybenzoate-AMP ligase